ncbi:MAG TPA: YdeI/OmpD-associated family protein [Candidatus Paceibacterota bacterium]|nr:YdeI/OmpD-associated family protein [Candidatus Paceibacterota bacterium]
MTNKTVAGGVVHTMPADFRKAIASTPKVLALWQDITPLARNEWICWVISGKMAETRDIRIKKALSKMKGGMRRPCCWAGCMHRTDKTLSPSQKFVLSKQSKK